MSDRRRELQGMFDGADSWDRFGDMLTRMHVQGFRCHTNTVVDVTCPITAFCGLNGTGKSTLLQLAAAAYKRPPTGQSRRYYIRDFLLVGKLDPAPFTAEARVEYQYLQSASPARRVTVSRSAKQWSGYKRRPERTVFFAGIGLYLPRIEQRDFVVRQAGRLSVVGSCAAANRVRDCICMTLGLEYDSVDATTVSYSGKEGEVATVQRGGVAYSEMHMGYGEGRSQYLIQALETLPDRSLVLIEEPETSLHPSAQYQFGRYLVDVTIAKRHQILLTTHSEYILEALPTRARVYLQRTGGGVETIPGLTAIQARSLMTDGNVPALSVLVEDDCARAVLHEIIRRVDPVFLSSIKVCAVGGAETIATTIRALAGTGLKVAAVRDGDKASIPKENLFALPGDQPPEKALFASAGFARLLQSEYGLRLTDFMTAHSGRDHHDWFGLLADRARQDEQVLVTEAARAYASEIGENQSAALVALLKEACG